MYKSNSSNWQATILLLICTSLVITGCWDRRELEQRGSVIAVAVDAVKGNKNLIKVSIQLPIPIKITGGGGKQGGASGSKSVQVFSAIGRSMYEGLNHLQQRLNQRIFLGHTRVFAISETIARRGIEPIIDGYRRDPEMRRLMWPIVVKGEASEMLKANMELTQIPMVYVMELITNGIEQQWLPNQTMGDYLVQNSSNSLEPFLLYMEASKRGVDWKGIAVFDKYKMIGTLNDHRTRTLLQLRDKRHGGEIVFSLPNKKNAIIVYRPTVVRRKISITNEGGRYSAHYRIKIQGDIVETTFHTSLTEPKIIKYYQKLIKEEFEQRAENLIHSLQKELHSDILGLGHSLKAHHYHDYWKHHDWKKEFPNFPITVEYDVYIRRMGMKLK